MKSEEEVSKMMSRVVRIILAVIVIAGWGFYVYPQNNRIIFKSAIVWRTDGKGDYLLPQLQQGVYETDKTLFTEGQIKSIVINWKSKGQVSLEASADGGINYVPVINGVPVYFEGQGARRNGQGRGLKWKAMVSAGSQLEEVKVVYTDDWGVSGTFGEEELSEFSYRKKIQITVKGLTASLFNYPVKLRVGESFDLQDTDVNCNGNLQTGLADIRFTAADGQTLLPYYIAETTGADSIHTAVFFVKVPQIPAQGVNIYIYYGNRQASDDSNIYETFEISKDSYKDLKEDNWNIEVDSQGVISLSNEDILIKDAGVLQLLEVSASDEEKTNLPKFYKTQVKENGNLVLAEGNHQGRYTSLSYGTGFDVRIITSLITVIQLDTGVVKLDISADGGSSYRANCLNHKYYYASLGDFSAGNEIVYQLAFEDMDGAGNHIEVDSIKLEYASGQITLISPVGGDIFVQGKEEKIMWSASEYGVYNMRLEYSPDNGETFTVISTAAPNTGIFLWTAPQIEMDNKVLIKISDPLNSGIFDVSDNPFTISSSQEPPVKEAASQESQMEVSMEEIDLSKFIDKDVIRSDKNPYDVLVKVLDKMEDINAGLDDAEITYKKGEIIEIKPAGYEWGSSEKRKFLIIQVYLSERELDETKTKHINTGIDSDGAPLFKMQKNIVDLEKLGFYGKKTGTVRKSLENNILTSEIIEPVVE